MTETDTTEKQRETGTIKWQKLPELAWWAAKDFMQDNGPQWAAAIAYYALLSTFPLLLAALSIASLFVDPQWVIDQASNVMKSFLPTGQDQIREVVRGAFQARGGISVLSVALLLWTGSRVFGVATQALNVAFDADESYGFLKRTLVQLAAAASLGLLFIVALSSRVVINLLWRILPLDGSLDRLRHIVTWSIPALLLLIALYLTYRVVPRRRVQVGAALAGAVLSTFLFMVARPLFLYYVQQLANYNLIYGSLAIVVILVLWTWLVANIFLFGGEVASLVKTVLLEGRSRSTVEERHRLRSPVRRLEGVIGHKLQGSKQDG
jgi:membrane protein